MSKYKDVVDLAKTIEMWAGKLRYKDNINENIPLSVIVTINKISSGNLIFSDDVKLLNNLIKELEKVEKIPEEIKNKLLLITAIYGDLTKSEAEEYNPILDTYI